MLAVENKLAYNNFMARQAKNSDDLIYTEIKERISEQNSSIKSVDTKSAFVLSFVAAVLAGLVNSSWFNGLSWTYHLTILAPFGITCGFSLAALLVRQYRADPDPTNLIERYKGKDEDSTKGQLTKNYEEVFSNNQTIADKKANLSKIGFVFLAISILALMFTVLFNDNLKGEDTWQTTRYQHPLMQLHQQ